MLNSKVLSCFSGVIMSIRSFFLFSPSLVYSSTSSARSVMEGHIELPGIRVERRQKNQLSCYHVSCSQGQTPYLR